MTGIVHFAYMMSLDGFVAGPNHEMDWFPRDTTMPPGIIPEYIENTGAVLTGRDGYDSAIGGSRPYGGKWQGPIFVLTSHPEDARPADDITFLSCPVEEAVRIGLEAANGKNLGIFSPTIGAQLFERGLIDEVDIHIAPVIFGDGKRLYNVPGGAPIRLHRLDGSDPTASQRVHYRPVSAE